MKFMSPQQKNTVDSTFTWIFRGLIVYFFTMINAKLNSIEDIQRKQDVQENRIVHLEENQKDINTTIRFTENRVNRIERISQFNKGDVE